MSGESSLFIEMLTEELRDFLNREVEEDEVEDALFQLSTLIPLDGLIARYLEWKESFDFEKLNEARSALFSLVARVPEEKEALSKFGLKVLSRHLTLSAIAIESAIVLTLLGHSPCSGSLLRLALESAFKGISFEHLLSRRFRGYVYQEWNNIDDSFVKFLRKCEDKSRRTGLSLKDILTSPEVYSMEYLKMRDVLKWLLRWEIFPQEITELLNQLWSELSREVHGGFEAWFRGCKSTAFLDRALEEIVRVIDLILFGVLKTITNLTALSEIKQVKTEFFSWDKLKEHVSKGDLKCTKILLESLRARGLL